VLAGRGDEHVRERNGGPVPPVPGLGPVEVGDDGVAQPRRRVRLVAFTHVDRGHSDQSQDAHQRAGGVGHAAVGQGDEVAGRIGVSEPGRLAGQLQRGFGGEVAVVALRVRGHEGLELGADVVDPAAEPIGAQPGDGELRLEGADLESGRGIELGVGAVEVPVSSVGDAAEPVHVGEPRRGELVVDVRQRIEHSGGVAAHVRERGQPDGAEHAGADRPGVGQLAHPPVQREEPVEVVGPPAHEAVLRDCRELALEVTCGPEPDGGRLEGGQ
jgi:hypothetical protein